jgi:acetoin utilization deacetylase AcuC-like enzyme
MALLIDTIYSNHHRDHAPKGELNRGKLVTPFERPERADRILAAVRTARLGSVEEPQPFPLSHAVRVHSPEFVDFLQNAYRHWLEDGRSGDAMPNAAPIRRLRADRIPTSIDGRLSYYVFDASTPITEGTWSAAKSSMDVALTGASRIASGKSRGAFALCRPPGHHAAFDFYGGYCFLNNAAIAAQYLRDHGAARVAVLDVDYHHGNGTQDIFYERSDVLFASIHADPATDYPYFLGYADETGARAGEGYNLNLPLPRGSGWDVWSAALDTACARIVSFNADALVVSLGVDTFEKDPISAFRLKTEDYLRAGSRIGQLGMPTLVVMEGGYALDEIGANVVSFLIGLLS